MLLKCSCPTTPIQMTTKINQKVSSPLILPMRIHSYPHVETLTRALTHLESYQTPIQSQTISILTRRCTEPLSNARSIPAQYRGARRSVTSPSPFVSTVWRPLGGFFASGGPGERLKEDLGKEWCEVVFEDVVVRYVFLPFYLQFVGN